MKPSLYGVEFSYLEMNGIMQPCIYVENRPASKNENEMTIVL